MSSCDVLDKKATCDAAMPPYCVHAVGRRRRWRARQMVGTPPVRPRWTTFLSILKRFLPSASRLSPLARHPEQILSVGAFLERLPERDELVVGDEPLIICDLFGTGDTQPLTFLQGLHKGCSLQQAVLCSHIEPGKASTHAFDVQLATFKVGTIHIGDL